MELLSVCVAHYRRSYVPSIGGVLEIFPRCVDSLCRSLGDLHQVAELVICDWPHVSQDGPLRSWILKRATIPVRVIERGDAFSRGLARNIAAKAAQGSRLFFLDTDMLVVPEVIVRGLQCLADGLAFFPLYKRQNRLGSLDYTDGIGTGNAIVLKEHYLASGGFPEPTGWGGEDTAFCNWFKVRNLAVRKPIDGFLHMWHPRTDVEPVGDGALRSKT